MDSALSLSPGSVLAFGQWRTVRAGGADRMVHCELSSDGTWRATVWLPADNGLGVRWVRGESGDGMDAALAALEDALALDAAR